MIIDLINIKLNNSTKHDHNIDFKSLTFGVTLFVGVGSVAFFGSKTLRRSVKWINQVWNKIIYNEYLENVNLWHCWDVDNVIDTKYGF